MCSGDGASLTPPGHVAVGHGGFGIKKCVYQRWPDTYFPPVNFLFYHYGHFGLAGGCRGKGGGAPPMVYGHSNTSLGSEPQMGPSRATGCSVLSGPTSQAMAQAKGLTVCC